MSHHQGNTKIMPLIPHMGWEENERPFNLFIQPAYGDMFMFDSSVALRHSMSMLESAVKIYLKVKLGMHLSNGKRSSGSGA